jgi:hypothetical protein
MSTTQVKFLTKCIRFLDSSTKGKIRLYLGLVLTAIASLTLVGCGGDSGVGDKVPTPKVSYYDFDGFTWSSTTTDVFPNPPTSMGIGQIEITANEYCSQSTCDANLTNCRATNFNGERGWTLPSETQLIAFCQAYLKSPLKDWVAGQTWESCSGFNSCKTVDFSNACKVSTYVNNALNFNGQVTCVKKKN